MGIPVTLPSLPEQRKIAAFLTAMDDVIAAAKEQMEAMQEFKKACCSRCSYNLIAVKSPDHRGQGFCCVQSSKASKLNRVLPVGFL